MKLFLDQTPNQLTQDQPQPIPQQQYRFNTTPSTNTSNITTPPRTSYANAARPQQTPNPLPILFNHTPATQNPHSNDTHMPDADAQTSHTSISGTSLDQRVKTLISAMTAKPGDNSTAMTSQIDSSVASTETNPVGAESLSENYNPVDPSPRTAQKHDVWMSMNTLNIE